MFTHRIVRSKNWHVRTGLPALLCLVLLSLEVGEVRAASKDLQGTWLVNANGWTFTMRLSARGRGIAGTWDALNNSNPRTLINGTVAGNRIRFTRSAHNGVKVQSYEGKLIRRGRGRWYARLWLNHRLHHFKNEHYWYGVTMLSGDRLLGTAPARDAVPTSRTARMLDEEQAA